MVVEASQRGQDAAGWSCRGLQAVVVVVVVPPPPPFAACPSAASPLGAPPPPPPPRSRPADSSGQAVDLAPLKSPSHPQMGGWLAKILPQKSYNPYLLSVSFTF